MGDGWSSQVPSNDGPAWSGLVALFGFLAVIAIVILLPSHLLGGAVVVLGAAALGVVLLVVLGIVHWLVSRA